MGPLGSLAVARQGGGIASAYACRLLGDLGATVTWVEPPTGDPLREEPGLFSYLAGGARSGSADGSDLLIGALVDLPASAPQAVVQVSPAGSGRDLPDDDLLVQAAAGWVSTHGDPGSDPVRVGGRAGQWVAGSFAAVAGLTAWRSARQRGTRVVADLSVKECLVGTLAYPMLFQRTLDRVGVDLADRRFVVPGIVACADGWVGINALTAQHWSDICVLLETPEFADRQRSVLEAADQYAAFLEVARPWLSVRGSEEIVDLCQAFRIPAAPVGDGSSIPDFAHFSARDIYRAGPDGIRRPRPPYRFSTLEVEPARPAPTLAGGAGPADRPPAPTPTPLADLRVIDLGIFWSAPYLTMYLGSLGADVVKIESIQRPDAFRYTATFPQLGEDWYEQSLVWQATNLDKRSVTLDLTSDEGRALAWRLIDGADVLVENFSPRVAESFGLDGAAVAARWPGLIYLRKPGFGLDGPWRDHVGWAMSYEQAAGLAAVTGFAERSPLNPGGFADPVVGMHAAVALMAALEHREATGEGQVIEIPQIEVLTAITAEQVIRVDEGRAPLGRAGNEGPSGTDRVLEEDGRWVADSGGDRVPVLTVDEMATDPDLVARDWYEELEHPITGAAEYPGWPFRLMPGPARAHHRAAPTLGQHNQEVLASELGLDEAALVDLTARRIIGVKPVGA